MVKTKAIAQVKTASVTDPDSFMLYKIDGKLFNEKFITWKRSSQQIFNLYFKSQKNMKEIYIKMKLEHTVKKRKFLEITVGRYATARQQKNLCEYVCAE